MAIKAIMCDVDGTLLNSQGVVSPYTIEQIKRIKAQGVLFGLATGRDVHSVKNCLLYTSNKRESSKLIAETYKRTHTGIDGPTKL